MSTFKIGDLIRYDYIFNGLAEMIGIILELDNINIKSEYSSYVFIKAKILDEEGNVSWVGTDRLIKLS